MFTPGRHKQLSISRSDPQKSPKQELNFIKLTNDRVDSLSVRKPTLGDSEDVDLAEVNVESTIGITNMDGLGENVLKLSSVIAVEVIGAENIFIEPILADDAMEEDGADQEHF